MGKVLGKLSEQDQQAVPRRETLNRYTKPGKQTTNPDLNSISEDKWAGGYPHRNSLQ